MTEVYHSRAIAVENKVRNPCHQIELERLGAEALGRASASEWHELIETAIADCSPQIVVSERSTYNDYSTL